MMNLDDKTPQDFPAIDAPELAADFELCDRWILSRFNQTVQQTRANIENYALGEAANGLYEFIWGDFCDWYIELIKSRLWQDATSKERLAAQSTLAHILDGTLKLLHPLMPHITEEIWQTLTQSEGTKTLAIQSYPEISPELLQPQLEKSFELLFGVIRTIRNLRAEASIKPGAKISVILQTESTEEIASLQPVTNYIKGIAKLEQLTITNSLEEDPGQVIVGIFGTIQVIVPLSGMVDIPALRSKLEKNLAKVEKDLKSLSGRLNNPGFVNKAPTEVIQAAKDALAEAEKQAEILRDRLDRLQ